ncbi:Beta-xylosidase [Micromonospora sediminicola]|uniref:Beta-xylosidase n=1 Tax=Micromonospora sediminicola TaxID=946078 RepID=A0A1A9BA39_9ACTN|nr:RICIN domain-containing protein [Micromonospora sediminicola]SBT66013.1 Beta-xylosidase [Micromonospora sediminicola]
MVSRGRLARLLAGLAAMLVGGALVTVAPVPASAATVDTGAWYVLVNRNSGKALDLYNQATNDGARITQWSRNDGAWQQWQFVDSGGGWYRIRSRHSGKVLDVTGASTANGTAVVQWSDHNGTNQQFRLADSDSGYVRLVNRNSNKVVEVQNAATTDGGNIVQYDDWNGANQQWQLVRVGDGGNPNPGGTFTNPAVWQDFADVDIIRVGDVYYMSASTMHYSPGAPVLRSWDLVNWEFAGHSVPRLDFGAKYDLTNGAHAYVDGIWASTLNYRPSNRTYYWAGCVDFAQTHIYTAGAVDGAWSRLTTIPNCYYDAGMLIDDNDTMYVAYGNGTISVAQLSADGRSQVRAQQVYQTPSSIGTLEGARFYKRNGAYYIWLTRPANGQYVLKSTNGPFGPYEQRQVLLNLPGPISGGGVPHQGGLVQTQNGSWYYMAFTDAYPGGRMPTLAPITWTADGWPQVQTVNGAWGASYPNPLPLRPVKPLTGTDTFAGATLGVQYEWNHNPDNSRWSVNNGLRLQTATVTNDLYRARNTLTHRIQGPTSTGTVELDYSGMRDGDRAGLAMLRDSSAWIGVRRDNGTTRVVMTNGLTMGSDNWNTTSTGTEIAGAPISGGRIWLRANADIRPGSGRQARFSYSTDGVTFVPLGNALTLNNAWQFFMGYRFGIFNYATQSLGGAVTVRQFSLTTP